MAEFLAHTAPWAHNANDGTTTPSRLQSTLRSLTPTPKSQVNKQVTKSTSTPQLGKMAAIMASRPSALFRSESEVMNTIPDPRSPTPRSAISRNDSGDSSLHPDLSDEVATLSTKLVNAINHQTTLDDSLQHTRHELDEAREKVAELEAKVKRYESSLSLGQLVEKEVYDKMENQLSTELAEEKRRRADAEKAKRRVDGEVEALTSALFEEANTMVAAARKETEASEKRNDQLKQQLQDTEVIVSSQREQLQDLKGVMEQMSSDRDENERNTLTSTAPSTPAIGPADKMSRLFEAANLTPNTPGSDDIPAEPPLYFSHLLHPVLRNDLTAYKEFQDMIKVHHRASAPSSRATSGNYGSLNVIGLGSLTNSSTTSLPSTNRSPNSSTSSGRDLSGLPNLKDEKFFKRALTEDIEPTLRLDIAPGLSWMARRTVLNSITAGSLVVEPHPPAPKFRGPVFSCSLCGENRKAEQYGRKYRFKVSEAEDAQRYPLCDHCLGRVRAACDYIGFLRMVAAGHFRAESEDEKKNAWEESVRLRERMFWCRLGGGVVPAFLKLAESPSTAPIDSTNSKSVVMRSSEESVDSQMKLDSAVDMSEPTKEAVKKMEQDEDPFKSKKTDEVKRVSIGKTVISPEALPTESSKTEALDSDEERQIEKAAEEQLQNEVKKSTEARLAMEESSQKKVEAKEHQRSVSTPMTPPVTTPDKEQRLSLAIPGAFA